MILVDYSALSVAAVIASIRGGEGEFSRNFAIFVILNSLLAKQSKFGKEYGKMILCCDKGSWRKKDFPFYKHHRAKAREESDIDWSILFDVRDEVKNTIRENSSWLVVETWNAEADDVIAVLSKTEGKHLIVSSDKDFRQLHNRNVKQFFPFKKKVEQERDPKAFLFEHIIRGDMGDGVPNVKSKDDSIVNGDRQSPITEKFIETMKTSFNSVNCDIKRNWERNQTLIDLSKIPLEIVENISGEYEKASDEFNKLELLKFLSKYKLSTLQSRVENF